MDKDAQVRVLFTTSPGIGHVHPMVPLAHAFRERGATVGWAAHDTVCRTLAAEGFDAMPAGLGAAESMAEFNRRFPEIASLPVDERPNFMFPRLFGSVRAGPMLADLIPMVRDWTPALIINEAGEFAAPIAAAAAGIPSITHGFGSLTPRARVATAAAEVAALWQMHGLEPRAHGGLYDHLYLDIYPRGLRTADMGHVPSIQPLRPVAFATAGNEPRPEWLGVDSSVPLVYVTFGTVFNQDVEMIGTVIEAVRDLPVRVIVTVGPNGDPGVLGAQPDNVRVARYIAQTELLPFCAAVVSHAGSGTFLAALARGLPQVCLPQAADQFLNAAACEHVGAGISLQPRAITTDAVRTAARRVLSDESIRAAAHHVAQEIETMPGPDAVAGVLQQRFSA
jgi:UDP:flavonoid glycosyltransferase YjiC (YdhE family)